MANYLRPKRGSQYNAKEQNLGLKKGEIFLEFPEGRMGREPGRIVIGDGSTSYSDMKYATTSTNEFQPFITDPSIYVPRFENTVPASTSSATFDWNSTTKAINEIGSGAVTEENKITLPKSIGAIKKSVSLLLNGLAKHESDIEALNSSTGGLSSKLSLNGGTMTGTIVTPADNTKGIIPKSDDSGLLGNQNKKFHVGYIKNIYSTNIECDNLKGLASTASIAINANYANSATNASTASYAIKANSATNASTASYATNASTADRTVNSTYASTASYATNASTADYSVNASTAQYATKTNAATNASTAEYAVKANAATNASTAEYSVKASTATNASTAAYAVKTNSATNASTAKVLYDEGNSTYSINAGLHSGYSSRPGITLTYGDSSSIISPETIEIHRVGKVAEIGSTSMRLTSTNQSTTSIYGQVKINSSTSAGYTSIELKENNNTYDNMYTYVRPANISLGAEGPNTSSAGLYATNGTKSFLSLASGGGFPEIKLQVDQSSNQSYIEIDEGHNSTTYTKIYPTQISMYKGSIFFNVNPDKIMFGSDNKGISGSISDTNGTQFSVKSDASTYISIAYGDILRGQKWADTNLTSLNEAFERTLRRDTNNRYTTVNASTVRVKSTNDDYIDISGDEIRKLGGSSTNSGWLRNLAPGYRDLTDALFALTLGTEDLTAANEVTIYANSSKDVVFYSTVANKSQMLGVIAYNCGSTGLYVSHISLWSPSAGNVTLVIKNITNEDITCTPTCRVLYSNLSLS